MRIRHPMPMHLVLVAALAAPVAVAQTTEPPPGAAPPAGQARDTTPKSMSFTDLDANADGKVSRDEAAVDANLTRHFAKADRDGDGQLSQSEYAASHDRGGTQY